jgi:hypothetical protein
MIADPRFDTGRFRAPADDAVGVLLEEGIGGKLAGLAAGGAEEIAIDGKNCASALGSGILFGTPAGLAPQDVRYPQSRRLRFRLRHQSRAVRARRYLGRRTRPTNEVLYEALRDQAESGNIAWRFLAPRFPGEGLIRSPVG